MKKVNEIFGFLSPKQLTTLDNKTLREKASTLRNLYRDDLDKDELSVEIENFKYTVKQYKGYIGMDRVITNHGRMVRGAPEPDRLPHHESAFGLRRWMYVRLAHIHRGSSEESGFEPEAIYPRRRNISHHDQFTVGSIDSKKG
ncbi:hypothetical protein AVEN_252600-1 [Araneus ventricosus]|uniref:Uncharacterized protein n=1 Tax=Araneus ventricosus TaxID=182803 RepID=A0A4Y2ARI2_ARAVE|nr:hypothetical protein AVEN_252600-1 [Araneus ventricosus]